MNNALSKYIDDHILVRQAGNNRCHRIRWRGKFITTNNGKTIWRTKGWAKAAFKQHLRSGNFIRAGIIIRDGLDPNLSHWKYCAERENAFIAEILDSGEVEFVEVK